MTARFVGWGRILHGLVLGFFQPVVPISIFVGLASILKGDSEHIRPPTAIGFIATLLVPSAPVAIVVGLGLLLVGRVTLRDLGWARPRLRDLGLGLAGLAFYLAVYFGALRVFADDPSSTIRTVASYSMATRMWLAIAGAHIAFFEETIFRGYLQPALVRKLGLWGGIGVTAIAFAAWHPPHFHALGFVVRLGLGLATGLLRGEDRPLFAAFLAHTLLWPVVGLA